MRCQNDWFQKFGDQAVSYVGRITQPIKLEEGNAWYKSFNWDRDYENRTYYTYNRVTNERRSLTEQQYRDTNYTLNER